jgi:cytosol alanyl aminopeptidase
VPVCVAFERGGKRAETCSLLDAQAGSIALDTATCPRWMMPNAGGRGYYRNTYTEEQVAALRDDAWSALTPTERGVVFFDVSDEVTLGKLPLQLALSFLPRLIAAGDRFSIDAALELPLGVRDLVPDTLRARYEAWLSLTFGAAAHKIGLSPKPGDSLDVEVVRGSLIHAVGDVGWDPELTAEAIKLAERWRELPPSIRGQVISLAAHASPAVFDRLLAEVTTEQDRARRDEIVNALAGTRDVKQQQAALALTLDPRLDIRDTQSILLPSNTEENRVAAQQFFKDHKDAILARIPSDGTTSGQSWLAEVFTSSCSPARRDEIVEYVTATFAKLPGGERPVRQAIERMDQCIARRKLLDPAIRSWLGAGAARSPAVGLPSKART